MDRVFQLKNGQFELTATMKQEDNMDFYNPQATFYFNDTIVIEGTAEKRLKEAFEDKGEVINIAELEWLEWESLLKNKENIKGWK